ncbi:hypothetical protein Lalb_Chr04g0250031 [Lupinus albus]|uniref:Uncharacterized protein n=1 Tax=Lupinus albus TaxID=3870 RepID=A0A6A4QNB7_LUPAL|nr:hypothetical protein Lalb_Chr04g0250031 [Lupinus albus]
MWLEMQEWSYDSLKPMDEEDDVFIRVEYQYANQEVLVCKSSVNQCTIPYQTSESSFYDFNHSFPFLFMIF